MGLLLWYSYNSKYPIEIVFVALTCGILKPAIRLYDFENTKELLGETEWNNLVITNLVGTALQTCMVTLFYS